MVRLVRFVNLLICQLNSISFPQLNYKMGPFYNLIVGKNLITRNSVKLKQIYIYIYIQRRMFCPYANDMGLSQTN